MAVMWVIIAIVSYAIGIHQGKHWKELTSEE